MTSNSPCASTSPCDSSPCASPVAERPRYFPRQIITPDDLTLEQDYFRNKLRRHNRLMHGWGVVCGAKVCLTPQTSTSGGTTPYQPWLVTVTSGYILGPYGDEILLDCCRTVDVRTTGASGVTGDPCVQATDPWCTDVYVQRASNSPLYVAIKYQECKTRPVRVQPVGCGCNDNTCEYSRLQDGYQIGILTSCPDTSDVPPATLDNTLTGSTPDCLACPSQPWVVLAQVTVDANGNITLIDNCSCRRIVASFAGYWRQCASGSLAISNIGFASGLNPQAIPPNTTGNVMTMTLSGVAAGATLKADLGSGVTIDSFVAAASGSWTLTFDVAATATPGTRTLVVSSGTSSATVPNVINILQPSSTLHQATGATLKQG